jgi:Carboxypeptidase regulatory-like domain
MTGVRKNRRSASSACFSSPNKGPGNILTGWNVNAEKGAEQARVRMKITTAILCLALAAAIAVAQPTSAPAPSAKPGTVDGVVTNSVTGEPVRKAAVTLLSQSHGFAYHATADAAGHFHFDKVDPDSYSIAALRDGFAIRDQDPHRRKPITVAEDQNVADIAVQLQPLAQVGGHVLDEDGAPIVSANIQALRSIYNAGRKQMNQVATVRSNDLGEFQFVNLDAGRYYLRVSVRSRLAILPPRTRMSHPELAYPSTYYPAGADIGEATAINLTPGAAMSGVDFRLRKAPAYHVRGKVIDGAGQPAEAQGVVLAPDGIEFVQGAEAQTGSQKDGTFDLHAIVNGSYIVSAQNFRNDGATLARQRVQVADQDASIILTMSSGFDVSGRVSVEGQAPTQMNGQVFLRADGDPRYRTTQAAVANDGTFLINRVFPDTYRIQALPGGTGLYVKSIRFGDQDVSDGLINLSQSSAGSLNIVFGTDVAQVQGTVETSSGETVPNAPVTLAPAGQRENRPDLVEQSGTDQYGHFSFQDLAPGDYQVFAWGDDIDFGMVQNADFRKSLASQAASVSLGPSASESVQLRLISPEDIEQAKGKLP